MHKRVTVNGTKLFKYIDCGKVEICTIEWVDRDEYIVYNQNGEGYSIEVLNSIDITELLATGSITFNGIVIKPLEC